MHYRNAAIKAVERQRGKGRLRRYRLVPAEGSAVVHMPFPPRNEPESDLKEILGALNSPLIVPGETQSPHVQLSKPV